MDDTTDNTEDTDDKEEDIDDTEEDIDDTEEDIDDTEDTDDTNTIEDVMVGVADKLAGNDVDATYTVAHAKWKHVNFNITIPKILQSLSTVTHGHKPELF